jgi:hypothetical protein
VDKTERQRLVAECRESGMTAKAWCEMKGIRYRQYINWATKINRDSKQNQPQQWAEITLAKKEPLVDEIKLNYGKWTISVSVGFNPDLLADILKVIAAVC